VPSLLQSSPKLLSRYPVVCFLDIDKIVANITGIIPRFIKNLLECKNMACGATTRTKVALGILQLCFNYFAEPFSRHLVYTFPGRPKEKDSPVVSAFPPVPHGAYGHDQPVCQSFCAFPENQATLHTRVSHLTPSMVKALSILGRMLSQSAPFGVLTARKVSSAVMLFSSHKCTSSVCGGAGVTTLRGL